MVRKIPLLWAVFVALIKLSQTQGPPCDPFDMGITLLSTTAPAAIGALNPNNCLCTYPCTVDKASQFIQFLYFDNNSGSYLKLNVQDPKSNPLYNYQGSIKFIIGGYAQPATIGWMPSTGMQLAQNYEVMLIDWTNIANCSVARTRAEIVPSMGQYVGSVIINFNWNLTNIGIIGHSIGGQIASSIGSGLGGKLGRITALDPPGMGYDDPETGLTKADALYVDVLHTTPGVIGTALLRGHADFFANPQYFNQPGCMMSFCSHCKSVYYLYASFFRENIFMAYPYQNNDSANTVEFGEFAMKSYGVFWFDTTSCYGYAIN